MAPGGVERICLRPTSQTDFWKEVRYAEAALRSILIFGMYTAGMKLRKYQVDPAIRIVDSVIKSQGLSFVIMFPRQSGKNVLQAHIESYLLVTFSMSDGEIVKISPTWKPQSLNAMHRLERNLKRNLITKRHGWTKESGYIYRIDTARIYFLSGSPTANIVGATASLLLECDEAQDVSIEKWDKEIAPMAASTNATRVFWGTAWTSKTLLARELRAARKLQKQDGIRRVFVLDANEVMAEVPAYGKFVQEQVNKLGRNHPMVKTQYFSEEINAEGGMFPKSRQALMQGRHQSYDAPIEGQLYAFTIDVAGEDEGASDDPTMLQNPQRDSTALTVFEVDLSTLDDEIIAAPTYKMVQRFEWIGTKHTGLYSKIRALIATWQPNYVIIDATGVGAGLASFLVNAYDDEMIIPFLFTVKSKSDLGWNFLAVVETGRYKEYASHDTDELHSRPALVVTEPDMTPGLPSKSKELSAGYASQRVFWQQVENAQMSIKEVPNKIIHWGVPEGTRDPSTGELIHDDLLISAAMCALLDDLDWHLSFEPIVIQRSDPLADIDRSRRRRSRSPLDRDKGF